MIRSLQSNLTKSLQYLKVAKAPSINIISPWDGNKLNNYPVHIATIKFYGELADSMSWVGCYLFYRIPKRSIVSDTEVSLTDVCSVSKSLNLPTLLFMVNSRFNGTCFTSRGFMWSTNIIQQSHTKWTLSFLPSIILD